MIFLIHYDRNAGKIVSIQTFADSMRRAAEKARLGLEVELRGRGDNEEIVLLEAASELALRRTHRRYFQSASDIISTDRHG